MDLVTFSAVETFLFMGLMAIQTKPLIMGHRTGGVALEAVGRIRLVTDFPVAQVIYAWIHRRVCTFLFAVTILVNAVADNFRSTRVNGWIIVPAINLGVVAVPVIVGKRY